MQTRRNGFFVKTNSLIFLRSGKSRQVIMNWTRVHVRTFYSRVLQCKLNRTELVYKRTLPLFLYMWQIKTSDDELDKSVCAGG